MKNLMLKKMLLLLTLFAVVSCTPFQKQLKVDDCMGIINSTSKYIHYASTPNLNNLTRYTMLSWFYQTAWATGTNSILGAIYDTSDANIYQRIQTSDSLSVKAFALLNPSGTVSSWRTPSNSISLNTLYFVAGTLDTTNIANDPLLYINGVSQTVTESTAPSGSYNVPANAQVYLANNINNNQPLIGTLYSYLVYDRILSADEIANAFASRLLIPSYKGLVFSANLNGCAGGLKDGDAMGAGNTVRDFVKGGDGVPSGSPIFTDNNILALGGG